MELHTAIQSLRNAPDVNGPPATGNANHMILSVVNQDLAKLIRFTINLRNWQISYPGQMLLEGGAATCAICSFLCGPLPYTALRH